MRGGLTTASNVKQEPQSMPSSHNHQTKEEQDIKEEFGDISAQDLEGFVDPMDTS